MTIEIVYLQSEFVSEQNEARLSILWYGSIGLEKDSKYLNVYNEWTDDWIKNTK